jgi:uncharacterized membrane protein
MNSLSKILLVIGFTLIITGVFLLMFKSIPVKQPSLKDYTCVETTYKLNKDEIFIICGKEVIQ